MIKGNLVQLLRQRNENNEFERISVNCVLLNYFLLFFLNCKFWEKST